MFIVMYISKDLIIIRGTTHFKALELYFPVDLYNVVL